MCCAVCVCTACNLQNNRTAYTHRIRDGSLTAEQITHSGNKLCVCMCICRCVSASVCVWGGAGGAPPPANARVKHKAIQLSTRPEGGGSTREEQIDGIENRRKRVGGARGSEMSSLGVKGEDREKGLHVQMAPGTAGAPPVENS